MLYFSGLVEVEPDIAGVTNAPQGKKIKLALNCNDKLYNEIRDMNFTQIGPFLNRKAKEIDEYYKSRHGASVTQLRDFTKKLSATQQEHTSLRIRIPLIVANLLFLFIKNINLLIE
jgi:hypothetical protein